MSAIRIIAAAGWLFAAAASSQLPEAVPLGYLESYVDPDFGATVTRITGDPGEAIPGIDGVWDNVARHHYAKDAVWNCLKGASCNALSIFRNVRLVRLSLCSVVEAHVECILGRTSM